MAFILENFKGSEILDLAQILATSMNSNKVGILTRTEVRSRGLGCSNHRVNNSELKSAFKCLFLEDDYVSHRKRRSSH